MGLQGTISLVSCTINVTNNTSEQICTNDATWPDRMVYNVVVTIIELYH